jgi:class 3 adenylate cyclase
VDPSELLLRVRNHLAVKSYQDELTASRSQSDRLLLSVLPGAVAERLKRGETVADEIAQATVLFADLVAFTDFAARADAASVVRRLNEVFRAFDALVAARGLEKIKTIGDAYMVAGGVLAPRPDHAAAVVEAGLEMIAACDRLRERGHPGLSLRVGVHTGPLVAGVIGDSKATYDLWGDTVNVASRMESMGLPGRVQLTDATRQAMGGRLPLVRRGVVEVKGRGPMLTWFVDA